MKAAPTESSVGEPYVAGTVEALVWPAFFLETAALKRFAHSAFLVTPQKLIRRVWRAFLVETVRQLGCEAIPSESIWPGKSVLAGDVFWSETEVECPVFERYSS